MARQAQAFVLGFLKQGRAGEVVLLLRWPGMRSCTRSFVLARLLPLMRYSVSKYSSRLPKPLASPQPAALPINERTN